MNRNPLNTIYKACFAIIVAGLASSCSFFRSEQPAEATKTESVTEPEPQERVSVPVEKLDRRPVKSGIEILWQIPQKAVEGFVVKYGFSSEDLKYAVKVPAAEIEKFEHPVHGFVYRYLLEDIPEDEKVYITVSAYEGALESEPSAIFVVKPLK